MTTAHIVIPFRDRGRDPLRAANLECVLEWWRPSAWPVWVVDDGREGDEQFNRSAAYNRGLQLVTDAGADVVVYTESDMLVPWEQIEWGVEAAAAATGLVVGFTSYRYLDEDGARAVRNGHSPKSVTPERVVDNGGSIGAVNIVSAETMRAVGRWDEGFEGSWYDDTAMFKAFEVAAGHTRWVEGPAWHLYHLPGWSGDHLTDEDKAATARNRERCELYMQATTAERIRELTGGAS